MDLFAWDDKYRLNHSAIDTQHQQLFRLASNLHAAMLQGQGHRSLNELLARLIDYTRHHFVDEEALMRAAGYPELAAHKEEHADLTRQAEELQRECGNRGAAPTMATLRFLRTWLDHHILGSDQKIAAYLRTRQKAEMPLV